MNRTIFTQLAGVATICTVGLLSVLHFSKLGPGSSFALSSSTIRIPARVAVTDYRTAEEARTIIWLQELEQKQVLKALDAHVIKPLFEDSRVQGLAVEGLEVSEAQFAEVNATVSACARILHMDRIPKVFVSEHVSAPTISENAVAPVIVIESSIVSRFGNGPELRFLIGREMGHIQAGHVRWLALIRRIGSVPDKMGFLSGLAVRPAILPLARFARECEMTADNAGLICAQDPKAAERALVRMATGSDGAADNAVNVEAYLRQGHSENLSKASDYIEAWKALSAPIPFAPERIYQLREYKASRQFKALWQ